MLGISVEAWIFLEACKAGFIVYAVYTGLRILRRVKKHSRAAVSLEDMAFWIFTAIYLFVEIYNTSSGSIRWFFVLGVVGSMILSACLIGKLEKTGQKLYRDFRKKHEKTVDKSDGKG